MDLVAVLLITTNSSADTGNHIRYPLLITGCSNLLTLTSTPPYKLQHTTPYHTPHWPAHHLTIKLQQHKTVVLYYWVGRLEKTLPSFRSASVDGWCIRQLNLSAPSTPSISWTTFLHICPPYFTCLFHRIQAFEKCWCRWDLVVPGSDNDCSCQSPHLRGWELDGTIMLPVWE